MPIKTAVKTKNAKDEILTKLLEIIPDLFIDIQNGDQLMLREKSGEDKLTQVLCQDRELGRY